MAMDAISGTLERPKEVWTVAVQTWDPPQDASPTRKGRLSRGSWLVIGICSLVLLVLGAPGCWAITHALIESEDNTYLERAQFTPDGRLLLTTTGGQVRVWSAENGRSLHTLEINSDSGEISPQSDLFAVPSASDTVDLWSLKSGQRVRSLSGLHADSIDFSPDGRLLLVIGSDSKVRIVELATGRLLHVFPAADATFSPNGRLVVTARGWQAEIRRLDTGRVLLTVHGKPERSLYGSESAWVGGLSPDGRLLLTLGVNRGQLWDARSGRLLHTYRTAKSDIGERPELWGVEFTRDGRKVLVWTEESDELWDVASGRRAANFADSQGSALSPDGRLLATDSFSGGLQIRSLPTAKVVRVLRPGEGASIYDMTFSPDSRLLVTTGEEDATVREVASGRTIFVLHHDVYP
jgi:WD40 repeat protein